MSDLRRSAPAEAVTSSAVAGRSSGNARVSGADAHVHEWRVDYSQPIIDTLPQQAWYVCECGVGQMMDYPPSRLVDREAG